MVCNNQFKGMNTVQKFYKNRGFAILLFLMLSIEGLNAQYLEGVTNVSDISFATHSAFKKNIEILSCYKDGSGNVF